jgi:RNA polymerase sigma factor (sigma-70 family)
VRNVALKAGLNQAEADDVVQEATLAVAKRIRDFEHRGKQGSFRAWLLQQTRWRIADQFRKRLVGSAFRPEENTDEDEGGTVSMAGPDAGAAEFERIWDEEWCDWVQRVAIARVKRRVSARQFQLFDLHVLQGLSVREAAATGGSTMAAVYMAKSRVRRMFERELRAAVRENP